MLKYNLRTTGRKCFSVKTFVIQWSFYELFWVDCFGPRICEGDTCSIWLVENSAIIFSVFIFEPWEFLLQVASPILPVLSAGRDDPALILCSTLIQMPALSASWEGNSQKQFFLSAKWSAAGCSTCRSRQEGRVKHVIVIFLLGASKEVALTQNPRMKKFHESAIQPHISQSNKGKAPFRDCVEWIEFYWQRGSIVGGGGTCFPHLARTRRRIELLQNFWKAEKKSSNETSHTLTGH